MTRAELSAGIQDPKLRAAALAGEWPFRPMTAAERAEWRVPHDPADAWESEYHERMIEARKANAPRSSAPLLTSWARGEEPRPRRFSTAAAPGPLVNPSNNVAGRSPAEFFGVDPRSLRETVAVAMEDENRRALRRKSRRERYRLRRAHQHTIDVQTKEAERRWHLIEDADGVTWAKSVAGRVTHVRLGQLMCGRAPALRVPEKGVSIGKGAALDRAAAVEIRRKPDGTAGQSGTYYCGSVWCCPVCSYLVARQRGDELQRVYDYLAGGGIGPGLTAYFLTATVRHDAGMELKPTRAAVSGMWRKVRQRRAWRKWKGRLGMYGDVRALEVTRGANGWHPHLHVVFWTFAPLPPALLTEFQEWLAAEWRALSLAEIGTATDDVHGVQIERVHGRADYLAKLGIAAELTRTDTKEGRRGGRTPWQILQSVAAYQEAPKRERTAEAAADVRVWREWVEGMHRARQLTYSREISAVRRQLGEPDLSDDEAAAREAERGDLVATVPVDFWMHCARVLPGFEARTLEAAESGGGSAVVLLVRDLRDWWTDYGGEARPPPWWDRPGWWGEEGRVWMADRRRTRGEISNAEMMTCSA